MTVIFDAVPYFRVPPAAPDVTFDPIPFFLIPPQPPFPLTVSMSLLREIFSDQDQDYNRNQNRNRNLPPPNTFPKVCKELAMHWVLANDRRGLSICRS